MYIMDFYGVIKYFHFQFPQYDDTIRRHNSFSLHLYQFTPVLNKFIQNIFAFTI